MMRTSKEHKKDRPKQMGMPTEHSSTLPSSPGDSAQEGRPKDVTQEHATWKDLGARNVASDNPAERDESLLDEAIDLTFPASDPATGLSASQGSNETKQCQDEDEDLLDEAIELTFPASDPIAMTPHEQLVVVPKAPR